MHNFLTIARGLLVLALAVATLIWLWGDADKHRKAKPLSAGGIELAPNRRAYYAWCLIIAYLTYVTIHRFVHASGKPFNLLIAACFAALTVMIATVFPSTIVVATGGLEQVFWLRKNKRLLWSDIVEINTGEKSRLVTITGADGTKIVHSRQLPDRTRLLKEIKTRCEDNLPAEFPP